MSKTETINFYLMKYKELAPNYTSMNDKQIIKFLFENSYCKGGLRLTRTGLEFVQQYDLFPITKIKHKYNSRKMPVKVLINCNKLFSSPYYIDGEYFHLTDAEDGAMLTLCDNDLDRAAYLLK